MPGSDALTPVFERLRGILQPYAPRLTVVHDTAENYYLDAGWSERWKRVVFFGAATLRKRYVSFYLMPVYAHPALLDGISPALKARMQGKSCFNFTSVDEEQIAEMERLTRAGFECFEREGLTKS
jgi:hypothetical protein